MVMRILLLFSLAWIVRLTDPLFSVLGRGISGRDLILLGGGLFLLAKATLEIHEKLEGVEGERSARVAPSFGAVILQIMLLDIVFSLDSVITAVGMAESITVMVIAVVLAVGIMMLSAGTVSDFVQTHPTVKVLALSFLLLIGMSLVGEGLGQHIPKGYIYFAMAFSVFVEMINLRVRAKGVPGGPARTLQGRHAQALSRSSLRANQPARGAETTVVAVGGVSGGDFAPRVVVALAHLDRHPGPHTGVRSEDHGDPRGELLVALALLLGGAVGGRDDAIAQENLGAAHATSADRARRCPAGGRRGRRTPRPASAGRALESRS